MSSSNTSTFCDVVANVMNNVSINKTKDVIVDASVVSNILVNELFHVGCVNVIGYGSKHKDDYVHCNDFMSLNNSRLDDVMKGKRVHFVCVPPFDNHIIKTIKYIKECAKLAYSLSFVVPTSFKKEIYKNVFPSNFEMVFEKDYSNDAFVFNGKYRNAPCVLQVWVKKT
jgi:hypothetical protein